VAKDNQEPTSQQSQFALDRITARYEAEYRAGRAPRLEEYLRRYPDFARELTAFAFYFHTLAVDLPEPGTAPAEQRSPAAEKALARIRIQLAPPLPGLFQQGLAAGHTPPSLAELLGLSWDVLAKLEARAIRASSIPRLLIQRMADTLGVMPESITAYLTGATHVQASAFYYADQAPIQQQEAFLEAIHSSPALSPERKQQWARIVEQEVRDA
jgi:hypothetical protein